MGGPSALKKAQLGSLIRCWLTYIHAVRIFAIGTISKYITGALPAHFILPVGVPDFLVRLSAPIVGYLAFKRHTLSPQILAAWHTLGAHLCIYLPSP